MRCAARVSEDIEGRSPASERPFSWVSLNEEIPVLIFVGDARATFERPVDVQRRIVPPNAALVFGEPVVGGFVQKIGGV